MSEKILEVKHLGKAFGSNQVLRDIDFSVSPGDVTCIIGPSGSGKSTLLRCLNMLETPSGRCQSGFRKLLSGDRRIGTASAGAG